LRPREVSSPQWTGYAPWQPGNRGG
jgi:hypothetical protein